METLLGLIGKKLGHSFSRKYFLEKFKSEGLNNYDYQLFEIDSIEALPDLIRLHPNLKGLNVTIPYKSTVCKYLQEMDKTANETGAVNTIKVMPDRSLKGFNTDYFGFRTSFLKNHKPSSKTRALILGTGGASKAVMAVLKDLGIYVVRVSRLGKSSEFTYESLREESLGSYEVIINTTPLGMFPDTEKAPDINFDQINKNHFLFDLVYNPDETLYMKRGAAQGAKVCNGLEMLHFQADKSWEIWNNDGI